MLNSKSLADSLISIYRIKLAQSKPVVKNVTAEAIPIPGGGTNYELTKQMGPPEFDEELFRPLAEAIAEAVVSHIQSSSEVADNLAIPPSVWRVK
jgi:hypothetical protein